MPDPCPLAPRIAARLADPAARLDAELAAHLPQCEACRSAASVAIRAWPTDRSPSPSLAEWLSEPTGPRTVVSPYQAEALAGGRTGALELGPYLLIDRLGTGGMGEVYRAWHVLLRREDAVKTVRPELASNANAVKRFLREAESAARVRHPNVVHVYNADRSTSGGYYIAMEFVPGTDLGKLVSADGPLTVSAACDYVAQAAEGLQHAFANGLVHRDVKPANLLVTDDRRVVKVADFGLARAFAGDPASEMTANGAVLGTTDYMAPEQAENAHAADTRADVYALGCTLYFLLSGEVPYPGGSVRNKLERHAIAPVPDVTAGRAAVPAAVGAVARKCMAKRPADRYQTPGELASALRALAAPPLVPAPARPPAPLPAPADPSQEAPTASLAAKPIEPAEPVGRAKPIESKSKRAWLWAGAALLALTAASAVVIRGPGRDVALPDPVPAEKGASPSSSAGATSFPLLPPGTNRPARVPLPRPVGDPPWKFVAPCWSARPDKVRTVGFLADGTVCGGRAGARDDGSDVGFWEVWPSTGGTPVRSRRPPTTVANEYPVCASPRGLVTDRFQQFDPLTFAALAPLPTDVSKIDRGRAQGIDVAAATPDGKYLVATAAPVGDKRTIRLVLQWNLESDRKLIGWQVTTSADLKTVSVSADGHTVATATKEGLLVVMSTRRDTLKWTTTKGGGPSPASEVVVGSTGERVYTAHEAAKEIAVWDAADGRRVTAWPVIGRVYAMAASPDGRWLAAAGEAVSVWDLGADPPTRYDLAEHYAGDLKSVAFDDKSERLAVGGWGRRGDTESGEGVVWLWRRGP